MSDAEYNALLERENALWRELLAAQASARAKESEWENANAAMHDEQRRRAVRDRLANRVAAERRGQEGAV